MTSKIEQMRQLREKQRNPQAQQPQAPQQKRIGDGVPTKQQLIDKHGGYTPELSEQHEALIEKILESEEVMINSHRKHIDDAVDIAQ